MRWQKASRGSRALNPAQTPFSKHSPRHRARHPRPRPAPRSGGAAAGVAAGEQPRQRRPDHAPAAARGGRSARRPRPCSSPTARQRAQARPRGRTRARRPGNIQRPVAVRGDALTCSGPKRAVRSSEKKGSAGRKRIRLGRKYRGTREGSAARPTPAPCSRLSRARVPSALAALGVGWVLPGPEEGAAALLSRESAACARRLEERRFGVAIKGYRWTRAHKRVLGSLFPAFLAAAPDLQLERMCSTESARY
ncbi:translation initiation factor IF-2-like [Molothrus ater]|uniref:translation initiation factor IF-2-like n=1 Tax=Molothrus ater TaxID=84834 RepID=UPI0023E7FE54|nr:translation initiation factor IF-2-like [Molothrus ater]